MKNMKVKMKLMVSFLTVAAFAAIVGIVGIFGISQLEAKDTELYESNLLAIAAMADFRETYQSERTQLRAMILAIGDPAEVQKQADGFAALEQTITTAMAAYEKTIDNVDDEKGYYAAKDAYLGDYAKAKQAMIAAAKAGDFDLAYQLLKDAGPVVAPIVTGLQDSAQLNNDWGYETNSNNGKLAKTLIFVQVAVLIIAMAVALFFAFYISSLISKPLGVLTAFMKRAGETGDIQLSEADKENIGRLGQVRDEIGQCISSCAKFIGRLLDVGNSLETVANGDLTVDLPLLSESDTMGTSLNKMVANLNNMFSEIHSASGQVSIGSKQIADGAQSLAQGSTEQASAVQQLSASIADIAEKTKENATMATQAATLAQAIMGNAEKGSQQMDQMMDAVKEINQASQNISKVIKVIDDIAFQTNILALNAAVEAARAGQHGKGFAVVAEEVRSLAAKSAEAAKETGGLIANSMEKAELGSQIAGETAQSLSEIVTGINESTKIVGDIARSSDEQALAIDQVNTGIDQVAQVVQQNSATAEQSAAASQEMSGQSNALEELIAQFKLKDAQRALPSGSSRKRLPAADRNDEAGRTTSSGDFGKY